MYSLVKEEIRYVLEALIMLSSSKIFATYTLQLLCIMLDWELTVLNLFSNDMFAFVYKYHQM